MNSILYATASAPDSMFVPSAPDTAATVIRDAIMAGRLKPGDRILEQQWAAKLGIGQPTIREALKELEYQGMVRRTRQRGTFVNRLSDHDYARLLEVRIPLESLAVCMAARRINDQVKEELILLVDRMDESVKVRDMVRFHESDVAFHRKIWELAGNEYLRKCLESVVLRLFVFSVLGDRPNLPEENQASVEQHRGILEGLLTGDPVRAGQAFIEHTLTYWTTHYKLNLDKEAIRLCSLRSSA